MSAPVPDSDGDDGATLRVYARAKEATCFKNWQPRRDTHSDAYRQGWRFVRRGGVILRLSYEEWLNDHDEHRWLSEREAARRAASKVRRYAKHHRLRYLWTGTYRRPRRDLVDVQRDVENLLHQLRRHCGHVPCVVVAEPHPKGHGWHVHFALADFVPVAVMRRSCWQHGRLDVQSRRRHGESPKKIAGYLQKYVTKGFAAAGSAPGVTGHLKRGRRRYWCARGPRGESFVPTAEVIPVANVADGVWRATVEFRRRPRGVVDLALLPDFNGPPGRWLDFW